MTTADGTSWLYDVHVFPKNKTTYGDVTLEKTGTNGSAVRCNICITEKEQY